MTASSPWTRFRNSSVVSSLNYLKYSVTVLLAAPWVVSSVPNELITRPIGWNFIKNHQKRWKYVEFLICKIKNILNRCNANVIILRPEMLISWTESKNCANILIFTESSFFWFSNGPIFKFKFQILTVKISKKNSPDRLYFRHDVKHVYTWNQCDYLFFLRSVWVHCVMWSGF